MTNNKLIVISAALVVESLHYFLNYPKSTVKERVEFLLSSVRENKNDDN